MSKASNDHTPSKASKSCTPAWLWPWSWSFPTASAADDGDKPKAEALQARPVLEKPGTQSLVRSQGETGGPPSPGGVAGGLPRAFHVLERDQGARGDPGDRRRSPPDSRRLAPDGGRARSSRAVRAQVRAPDGLGDRDRAAVEARRPGPARRTPASGSRTRRRRHPWRSTGFSPAASSTKTPPPRSRSTPPTRET